MEEGRVDTIEFGKRLKDLRLARDLTFEQMGAAVGVAADTVRRLENALTPRPHERIIARFLRVYPQLAGEELAVASRRRG